MQTCAWFQEYLCRIHILDQIHLYNDKVFRSSSSWPNGGTQNQGCGVGSPVIQLRAISIIRLQLRLRADSDLQLY